MAEALFKSQLSPRGVEVRSAGIGALVGEQADPIARELMAERGMNIEGHRARQVELEDLMWADLILVMEDWQRKELEQKFPMVTGRVYPLGKWEGIEIPDPYRQSRGMFEAALTDIETSMEKWKQKLWR